MGVPYTPPPRVLTPAEKAAQAEKQVQTDIKAVNWLQTQAADGSASAQCSLGLRYLKGKGVPKDEALGRQWLEKAAAQDNVEAIAKLKEMAATQTVSSDSATSSESSASQPK
jgi:TPR repeat protein